jgi:predicted N-acetyltransferase YhbS
VTDYATFGWLCDVFVDPVARGQKLGLAMVEALVTLPEIRDLNLVLQTADAHKLYERFGFAPLWNPERWLYKPERRDAVRLSHQDPCSCRFFRPATTPRRVTHEPLS